MAVVEAGDDGAAPAVDGPAPGPGQRENFRIAAHGADHAVLGAERAAEVAARHVELCMI